jgi:hypothetical protein
MKILNEISKIELGFPHDFLNSEMIKDIIYGGTYPLTHNDEKKNLRYIIPMNIWETYK